MRVQKCSIKGPKRSELLIERFAYGAYIIKIVFNVFILPVPKTANTAVVE